MKVFFPERVEGGYRYIVKVVREEADKPIYSESAFFYAVKKQLIGNPDYAPRNPSWVKLNKVPGLNSIPYALRCNKGVYKGFYLYDGHYMVRDVAKDYREEGKVFLTLEQG